MIIYKRNFDENRQIYFLTKEESFLKYMKILEKGSNIINYKVNDELIYSKILEVTKYKKFFRGGLFLFFRAWD